MGKSSPAAPAAPDPKLTADAQSTSNINTANANSTLNNTNQVTPWGSQTFTQGPKDASGVGNWTSTITLDPAQQKLLDSSNNISQLMANLGIQQAGQVGSTLAQPIDYSKLTQVQNNPLKTSVDMTGAPKYQTSVDAGDLNTQMGQAGNINGTVQDAGYINRGGTAGGPITGSIANTGGIQTGINTAGTENLTSNVDGGQIQHQIDMSGVPALVGGDALRGAMQDSQKAAYDQQAAYLDTSYGQRQHDLENQLVQQGVLQGSDAWNQATQNLGQQRTFDYNNAFNNSFDKGLAANNQLYNQGLSTNENAYSQASNNANFANNAQSQQFNQGQSNALLGNNVAGQLSSQRLAQMLAGNTAQGQQYSQNANDATFGNAAQKQGFDQSYASTQQSNDAQQQQFQQNQATQSAAAAAQQQQYQQMLSTFTANNAAQQQDYTQKLAGAGLNNDVVQSQFGQGLADASLTNNASGQQFGQTSAERAAQLQELYQQQQNPLNTLNALRSGSQVTAPQFGTGTGTKSTIGNTDIAGLANNQYNGQLGAYNGQVSTNNANTQAGAGLASAAITALAMY